MQIPHSHNPFVIGVLSLIVVIAFTARKFVYVKQAAPVVSTSVPNRYSAADVMRQERELYYIQRQEKLLKRVDELQHRADKLLEEAQKRASQ